MNKSCERLLIWILLSQQLYPCTKHFMLGGGGGGGVVGSLAHKCTTHPHLPTSKTDTKWRIAPCYMEEGHSHTSVLPIRIYQLLKWTLTGISHHVTWGGGGGSLAHKCTTHPHLPTFKTDPKWHIAPCYMGGGVSLAHNCATHPHLPTSKMDPKWCIAPCYICTPKWHQTCNT